MFLLRSRRAMSWRGRWAAVIVVVGAQALCAAQASATPGPDLAITKTDGVTSATPGGSVTYTITASNAGPSNATGATVADTFPASETGTYTAVGAGGATGFTVSGTGNINDTVNLPAGASVTYTVNATINPSATGSVSNTATVTFPGDPNTANNSATDTDTLTPKADLAITKTDGVTSATPGGSVTYTITASNAGPSNATGATVADTFPASETGTYTAVGAGGATGFTVSGTGNINDTVNLPAGASVTYTVNATINPSATGSVSNTATVTFPGDPNTANNSATDTDTLTPKRKATSLRLRTSVNPVVVGRQVTYTARVTPAPDGGRVSFLQDGRIITGCTNIRVSKAGTATCRRTYSRAGAHTIQARYTGTAHFGNSRSHKLTEIVKRRQ
jgi:uncharacterized repeat protein (TIGR01451 family)